MQTVPNDIVRYQLLPFFSTETAVKLTRASQSLFHMLRCRIHRTQFVTTDRFFRQHDGGSGQSSQIGFCSSVIVCNNRELCLLFKYITDEVNNANPNNQAVQANQTHQYVRNLCCMHVKILACEPLVPVVWPETIHKVTFGCYFNQSLATTKFPGNLHTLAFSCMSDFNQSLADTTLPANLQTLTFGWDFNQNLTDVKLPSSLHTLTFGKCFNNSLVGIVLPEALQILTFGCNFNQSLANVKFPSGLHAMTFSDNFNQSLTGFQLPSGLQILTVGLNFKQSLIGIQFPPSLIMYKQGNVLNDELLSPDLKIVQCWI